MPTQDSIPRLSLRIAFRRNQIWFSELVGILFIAAALLCLTAFGAATLVNEWRITSNNRAISQLKSQRIVLERRLSEWRKKDQMSATLGEFAKGRLPRQTINLLVDLVYQSSLAYGYDPLLMLAVIHVESVFEPEALGRYRDGNFSGALGLMQIKFETAQEVARDLGISLESRQELLNPEINVALGVAYLTRLIAKFNSLKLGILAYNQGPGIIVESIAGKRPLSTRYYHKVLRSYYRLRQTYQRSQGSSS